MSNQATHSLMDAWHMHLRWKTGRQQPLWEGGVKHHLETLMPNSNHAGKAGSGDKTVETATENDNKKEKRKRRPPKKKKDETWTPNIYYFIYEPDSDLRSDGTLQQVFPGSTSTDNYQNKLTPHFIVVINFGLIDDQRT